MTKQWLLLIGSALTAACSTVGTVGKAASDTLSALGFVQRTCVGRDDRTCWTEDQKSLARKELLSTMPAGFRVLTADEYPYYAARWFKPVDPAAFVIAGTARYSRQQDEFGKKSVVDGDRRYVEAKLAALAGQDAARLCVAWDLYLGEYDFQNKTFATKLQDGMILEGAATKYRLLNGGAYRSLRIPEEEARKSAKAWSGGSRVAATMACGSVASASSVHPAVTPVTPQDVALDLQLTVFTVKLPAGTFPQ